mgnify:CR=1 FL=1
MSPGTYWTTNTEWQYLIELKRPLIMMEMETDFALSCWTPCISRVVDHALKETSFISRMFTCPSGACELTTVAWLPKVFRESPTRRPFLFNFCKTWGYDSVAVQSRFFNFHHLTNQTECKPWPILARKCTDFVIFDVFDRLAVIGQC